MLEKRKTINIFYMSIINLFILCIVIILINFFTKDNITKETIVGINPINLIKSNIVYQEPLIIVLKEEEKTKQEEIKIEKNQTNIIIEEEQTQKQENSILEESQNITIQEQKEIKNEEKQEGIETKVQIQPIEEEIIVTQTLEIEPNLMQYSKFASVGKIEIPKTEVNLPILEQVTVDGMKEAPCLLYSTGELNQNGNNLIVGHNFRNNTIFSNNQKLNLGDKIYITTLDGNKVEYTIYDKFITTAEDVSYIKRDTNNKPEITLSCCTDDDEYRIIILAGVTI